MKLKIGDKVRVVMCCYPSPNEFFLGKVDTIEKIYDEYNVRLLKYGLFINSIFIEKVDVDATDENMKIDENNIFDIEKYI